MIINKAYPIKFTFENTPYGCNDDLKNLELFKESIDYHKLNLGNPLKSSVTPTVLKQMEIDYDIQKKKYESSECINSFDKNRCLDLSRDITQLQLGKTNLILNNPKQAQAVQVRIDAMSLEYKNLKCDSIINTSRGEYILAVTDIFNTLDKKRIQSSSIYERNKRVFFGGVVLILGLALIIDFSKSKK